ncbi:hypothetical protein Q31b_36110 [Novipirellula aureliae]|uniref:Uncharacterized protein n=1 Tax=Novipirellula aureliae TaxID=2527966 RepID=A0A5C6DVA0_9BACT|nr:hypothetical protein Q31b_36110 [Novipirellula aureliae]
MIYDLLLAFSMSEWYHDGVQELIYGFKHMGMTQWGIASACAVAFSFLCLKGNMIK